MTSRYTTHTHTHTHARSKSGIAQLAFRSFRFTMIFWIALQI